MKRQLAFLISRAQIPLQWLQIPLTEDEAEDLFESDLQDCLFNAKLSEHFRAFGKELGVEEARSLEDVYKSHLENTRTSNLMNPRIFSSQHSQDQFL
jgi:26S proteasome regulatory subunit N1